MAIVRENHLDGIQWKVDRSLYSKLYARIYMNIHAVCAQCMCQNSRTIYQRDTENTPRAKNDMLVHSIYLAAPNYHYRLNNCYCCSSYSLFFVRSFVRSYSCALCSCVCVHMCVCERLYFRFHLSCFFFHSVVV